MKKRMNKIILCVMTVLAIIFTVLHPGGVQAAKKDPFKDWPESVKWIYSPQISKGAQYVTGHYKTKVDMKVTNSNEDVIRADAYSFEDRDQYYASYDWYKEGAFYSGGYEAHMSGSPGTAKVKLTAKINKKTYTKRITYKVEKYKNPFSKFMVGKKDFKSTFNTCENFGKRINLEGALAGKISIKAKSGYKIKSVSIMGKNGSIGKNKETIKSSDLVNSIHVDYINVKTGTPGWVSLYINAKDQKDLSAMRKLVKQLRANGSTVSTDLDDQTQYRWDNSSGISRLSEIDWTGKQLKGKISFSSFSGLKQLYCSDNQITDLDVSKCLDLEVLRCGNNQLTALDVGKNSKLWQLYCSNNQIPALNVSKCLDLKDLQCEDNQLTALDVGKNSKLQQLYCENNQIPALNVSKCLDLEDLQCSNNQLTALDVGKNSKLRQLYCKNNQIPALNVSKCLDLEDLQCSNNQLTALDVGKNSKLQKLYCSNNQIPALNVSKCLDLEDLQCSNNQLTALDVSKNLKLRKLYCYDNQITELDVSANLDLEDLLRD